MNNVLVPKPEPYELFDFIFPGGKLAKLCKVKDIEKIEDKLPDILKKFKITEALP